jgi:hypothetical protein
MHRKSGGALESWWPRVLLKAFSSGHRAGDGISGAVEYGKDCVRNGLDRDAFVRSDGLLDDPPEVGGHLSRGVVSLHAKKACKADDVRAKKRSDPAVGVAGSVESHRRRELALEPVNRQLEQLLRSRDVLEAELAVFAELELGRLEVLDDSGRCVRDEDLTTVRGCADPGRPMDSDTDVPRRMEERLRRMQPDANAKLGAIRPLDVCEASLDVDRGCNRIRCTLERREVRVALSVDHVALVSATRVLDQAAVLGANVAIAGTEPTHELG